jgi:glucose/arabinose dehydrogenase
MRSAVVVLAVIAVAVGCATPGTPVRTVADNLSFPWGLAFLPDGSALVGERGSARLLQIRSDGTTVSRGTVPGIVPAGEGGLLGLAVSPTYATDGLVFAYATTATDNRVLRFRLGGEPTAIVTGIPKSEHHNGGRLAFGPDRMLYVATGDAETTSRSQDLASLGGKILRVTPAGAPAPGNPFPASPVWSYGHRNVQGLAWDEKGRMYATEFGQNTWDEVNRIVAGGNYGWPIVEGMDPDPRFRAPLTVWHPADASPSGLAFAGQALWVGALRGERVWRLGLDADGSIGPRSEYYRGTYGRIRTVVTAPDGRSLWITTSNGSGDKILEVPLSFS